MYRLFESGSAKWVGMDEKTGEINYYSDIGSAFACKTRDEIVTFLKKEEFKPYLRTLKIRYDMNVVNIKDW